MKKAVISNRIYLPKTQDLFLHCMNQLKYTIPSNRKGVPPTIINDITMVNSNVFSIPVARLDLIPKDFEVIDKRVRVPVEQLVPIFPLREDQIEVYDAVSDNALINAKPGWGKALSLDTKIRIPQGWKTMEDISPGDIVITPNNEKAKVINKYTHKDKEMYLITFLDGRQIEACGEHLWSAYLGRAKTTSTVTTLQLKQYVEENKRTYIPLTQPISDTSSTFVIHPYIMGILLGAGGMTTNSITLSSADSFIIEKVKKLLPEGCTLKFKSNYDYQVTTTKDNFRNNHVLKELRKLQLLGCSSETKFIPDIYKFGSINDKLSLLQGLIDSDGYIETSGTSLDYVTVSLTLAIDFCEIIYSLGGYANIQEKHTKYSYKGEKREGKLAYKIRPSRLPFSIKKELASLPRKKDRINPSQYDNIGKLAISSIKFLHRAECACIEIDSKDKLYLIDNYIVTHNTFTGLYIANKLKQKTLIVTHNTVLRDQWIEEVEKLFGTKAGIIGTGKFDINSNIVVSNIQTLTKHMTKYQNAFGTMIVDECLDYYQTVETEEGPKKIGVIVNQKLPIKVKSYNINTNKFEWKQVVDWHVNPHNDLMIKFNTTQGNLLCTMNHGIYCLENDNIVKKPAELVLENDLLIAANNKGHLNVLNKDIIPLILGIILGDGSIDSTTSGIRVRVTHGEKQKEYLEYKKQLLNVNSNTIRGTSGYKPENNIYAFSTLTFVDMYNWKSQLYNKSNNKNSITKNIANQLTLDSWSIMYQDDGSISNGLDIRFSFCELSKESIKLLINNLSTLLNTSSSNFSIVTCSRNFNYLTLNREASKLFIEAIEERIHPTLTYKKGKYGTGRKFEPIPTIEVFKPYRVDKVLSIDFKAPTRNKRYNIEVEDNHNYIAAGKLVANCHKTPATTFKKVVDKSYARYKIGLSATLGRKDGKHVMIADYFSIQEPIKPLNDTAVKPTILIIHTNMALNNKLSHWANKITELTESPQYRQLIADIVNIKSNVEKYSVLCVGDRVDFLIASQEAVPNSGLVIGSTVERDKIHKKLLKRELNSLFGSTSIYKEGISVNVLDCLILGGPINNNWLLEQLIGRVTRPHPGKKESWVIDIVLSDKISQKQYAERLNYYISKGYAIREIQHDQI